MLDTVVELVFAQPGVDRVLEQECGISSDARALEFLRWNPVTNDWTAYPQCSQPLYVAPNEHVLYRELSVTSMPRLAEWKARAVADIIQRPHSSTCPMGNQPQPSAGPSHPRKRSGPNDGAGRPPKRRLQVAGLVAHAWGSIDITQTEDHL